ncbi:MAG TPA: DUF2147 domain-containing protein [Acidovorax sp.]|nr:DUF2147 domain-containing protein [Acidovorax sp.]
MPLKIWCAAVVMGVSLGTARAQGSADDFVGYWKTAQGDGIVQLKRCPLYKNAPPTALCGVIVWDAEVDNPQRNVSLDCNRKVFEASKFDGAAWTDGWAFDTRKRKFYTARLRMKGENLHLRAYVGSEINGETEVFTRVAQVPGGCEERQPEATSVKGVGR